MGDEEPEGKRWYNTYEEVPPNTEVLPFCANKKGEEFPMRIKGGDEIKITKTTEGPSGKQVVIVKTGREVKECTTWSIKNIRFRTV